MADTNLFEQLRDALKDLKTFLDTNIAVVRPAFQAVAKLLPAVNTVIDDITGLLGKLKTEIQNINVAAIPGLDQVTKVTTSLKAILEAAKKVIPKEADTFTTVEAGLDLVGGIGNLDSIKKEITDLIDSVSGNLASLKG